MLGNYTIKEYGGGYLDQSLYDGKYLPAPGGYESIDLNKLENRVLSTKIIKPKEDKPNWKIAKDGSPSPNSYKFDESHVKTQGRALECYKFSKNKGENTFIDRAVKQRKKVPGVGTYDITKADKVLSLGASRGWK